MAEPDTPERPEQDGERGLERVAADGEDLRARLQARQRHLEELHEELARTRVEADEQRAARAAAEEQARALERRASMLDKRVRYYQREERSRGGSAKREERRVRRLERALERSLSSRRDDALERAVRRVRELERELERGR